MTANKPDIKRAPAMAQPSPVAMLPVAYAAAIAQNAAVSITPSIPILMRPLCSTSSSPRAASSSGAAMLMVELRKASSISGLLVVRERGGAPSRQYWGIEGQEHENYQSLCGLDQDRRDPLRALDYLGAVVQRTEE